MISGALILSQGDSRPEFTISEYKGPERPTLSKVERQQAKRVLSQDPYFLAAVQDNSFVYESIDPWGRPNQEKLGAGIFVALPREMDFSMRGWPRISNEEALNGKPGELSQDGELEAGIQPDVEFVEARVQDASGFLAFVDLNQDRVVSLSPVGANVEFVPKDKSLYRTESEGE